MRVRQNKALVTRTNAERFKNKNTPYTHDQPNNIHNKTKKQTKRENTKYIYIKTHTNVCVNWRNMTTLVIM